MIRITYQNIRRLAIQSAETINLWRLILASILFLSLTAAACTNKKSSGTASPTPKQSATAVLVVGQEENPSIIPTHSATSEEAPADQAPIPTAAPVALDSDLPLTAPEWPASDGLSGPFSQLAVSPEQQAASDRLAASNPPIRDDIELARAYGGFDGTITGPPPAGAQGLDVGTAQEIKVLNNDLNSQVTIEVDLLAVSDHAYFWFDTGPGSINPSAAQLEEVAEEFDNIYEISVGIFGSEDKPGVDGDPRLHIIIAWSGRLF